MKIPLKPSQRRRGSLQIAQLAWMRAATSASHISAYAFHNNTRQPPQISMLPVEVRNDASTERSDVEVVRAEEDEIPETVLEVAPFPNAKQNGSNNSILDAALPGNPLVTFPPMKDICT